MAEKLLFIFNPYAGKGIIKANLAEIIDIFTKGGYDVVAHPTQAPLDAYHVVSETGRDYRFIVVSGGDGTLSEAVEGYLNLPEDIRENIRIGYIPSGSTNDFAISLGIPKSPLEAASAIIGGEVFKCDIGKFNDKKFNYVAGFGAFTDVSYATPQETKNMFGHMAYILEGIMRLPSLTSYAVKVKCNGEKLAGEFILGMVMNSNSVAGIKGENFFQADLCDGLFEVLLIKNPSNLIEFQNMITGMLKGEAEGKGYVLLKASEITFETEDDVKWTLDGEYGGNAREVKISVLPKAVNFVVPAKKLLTSD